LMEVLTKMAYTFSAQPAELIRLLSEQRACYRKLRSLSERQQLVVADDDPSAATNLLSILSARQRVVDELTALNAKLSPFRRDWTHVYDALDPETRANVKDILEESNALLSSVITADRQDSEKLDARREAAPAALSSSQVSGLASDAYTLSSA